MDAAQTEFRSQNLKRDPRPDTPAAALAVLAAAQRRGADRKG